MRNYSIKDLEQLSGIKAHTLRIWEQRYNLLSPKRTDTNIRYYDDADLRLILNVALLNEMGEVIIPQTDTPGAKAANVGATMAVLVTDCYTPLLQKTFLDGIKKISSLSQSRFNKQFVQLTKQEREALFNDLDVEAKAANLANGVYQGVETGKPSQWEPGTDEPTPHYFTLLKQLTLYCFFTSQVGATKVLRYVAIPGRYDGAFPYKKGDKAWAT